MSAIVWSLAAIAGALVASPVAADVQKPVVAVESIQGANQLPANLRTMIETAVLNSGRFTVMGADQFELFQKSETLCQPGTIWQRGKCVKGKLIIPAYRITASVTGFKIDNSTGVNVLALFSKDAPPCKFSQPSMSVDIRVTSSTNELIAGEAVTELGKKAMVCDEGSNYPTPDTGGLMRQVANKIAQKLIISSYPIEIIDLQPGNKMMLTYGEDFLADKQQIRVVRKGPMRRDSSGREFPTEIQVGIGQIVTLAPTTSVALLLCTYAATAPQIGDIARIHNVKPAVRAQRAPKGATLPGECK